MNAVISSVFLLWIMYRVDAQRWDFSKYIIIYNSQEQVEKCSESFKTYYKDKSSLLPISINWQRFRNQIQ